MAAKHNSDRNLFRGRPFVPHPRYRFLRGAQLSKAPWVVAQDDSDSDESEVPPADIEKYIAVYKAMQRDRSLTAETAAAQSGMTLEAFRQLEARVQRDEAALQRARDELQAAAKKATPAGAP